MEHTHCFFFVVGRTGFHDRAYEHFQKSASDGVNDHGSQDSEERRIHDFRQDGQKNQSGCGAEMRDHHGSTVTDLIYKFYRQQIDEELHAEIDRHKQCDLG